MNMKMKTLSLALVGLAGFGFAGAAAAGGGCPAEPNPPWTSTLELDGAVTITAPGLAGTSCLMESTINSGASFFARAMVFDGTPATEPRYRAAFVIDMDSLTNASFSDRVQIFSATGVGGQPFQLTLGGFGGQWLLSYVVQDAGAPTGATSGSVGSLVAGENHIEFDLQIGASGSLTMWLNDNDSDSATATLPPISIDSSAMVGVDGANVGLSVASGDFVTNFATIPAKFDQFDSRRTTFIGY